MVAAGAILLTAVAMCTKEQHMQSKLQQMLPQSSVRVSHGQDRLLAHKVEA